jgi:hypothetical protein
MMKYERLTERAENGKPYFDGCLHCDLESDCGLCPYWESGLNRLAELEDKIEQGKIIIPNFARNQEVYFIEYVMHAYPCPHCGEECYEEKVKGVAKGVICERIITDNQDGMDIWYTIQIEEKGKLKMFTKREEKEVFLTREEAEKRLKEYKNEMRKM